MTSLSTRFCCFLFGFFALGSALAEVAAATGANTAADLTHPLKVTVVAPEQPLELMEGWTLSVTIQNVSDQRVHLEALRWLVPPQLAATRDAASVAKNARDLRENKSESAQGTAQPASGDAGDEEGDTFTLSRKKLLSGWDTVNHLARETELGPGRSVTLPLWMPSTADAGTHWFTNTTILTWRYKEMPVTIEVGYKTQDLPKPGVPGAVTPGVQRTILETIKVRWLTPFRSMVFGGFLGALLAMTFYYLYLRLTVVSEYFSRRRQTSQDGDADQQATAIRAGLAGALKVTWREHSEIAVRQMATASVTVIIVLLLLASGNQGILPVSITVSDFVGAAFMGLIAHKIGKVTFDAIFGQQKVELPQSTALTAPALKGEWEPATQQARLTWAEQKEPKPQLYLLRKLATADEKSTAGKLLKEVSPGQPLEYTTSEGLEKSGDQAFFVLVVRQQDGKDVASKVVTVTRP